MNVDPQAYYDAAEMCAHASESIRGRVEGLRASLSQCGSMAGEYDGVKQWGSDYDQHAYDFFRAAETWVDASSTLADVAYAAGYNWAVAEHQANPSSVSGSAPIAPPPSSRSTYLQCMAPPPTSLGDNGDGLDSDVPGLLEQIGIPVPDGDSDKLTIAADAWAAFGEHSDIADAARAMATAISRFDGLDAPDVAILKDHLDVLRRSTDELASTASALASPVASHGQAVSDLRVGIKSASDELVWTVGVIGAVTAVAAVATVLFTGGLGALGPAEAEVGVGAGATAAAIASAANTIRALLVGSTLAGLLGAATATFAAINGITTFSALEAITMLVAQHLPGDDVASPSYSSPIPGTPEYADRREELAKDPAHGGNADDRSRREAAAALEAEAAAIIPGPIIRAPFNGDGQDQGDVVDADGQHWDVKSSPDLQPSYRPDAGKELPSPQTDANFIGMVEDQIRDGIGVLVDSDGMSTERRLHIEGIIENFPEWAGKVRWTS